MKLCALLWALLLAISGLTAEVLQYSKVFTDPARNNRQINTVIYYPSEGQAPVSQLPYAIFGHGWIMNHSNYQVLTNAMVNDGWIMAYPRTEEGLFPDHLEFAKDISFLQSALLSENEDPGSPLYQSMLNVGVVMGHSMGGGAAVLAAARANDFVSLLTFAAAETNVSAIQAAANVQMPSLTFAGSGDTITPPASHQIPIYQNLDSVYKSYIEINGAGHLNLYTNALVPTILGPWRDYLSTGDVSFLEDFETILMNNSAGLNFEIENNLTVSLPQHMLPAAALKISCYPNPFTHSTTFELQTDKPSEARLAIYNLKGQQIIGLLQGKLAAGRQSFAWDGKDKNGHSMPGGVYIYRFSQGSQSSLGKLTLRPR